MPGHFVALQGRHLLQLVEADGEDVLEQAFVGAVQEIGQQRLCRLFAIGPHNRDEATRSPVGDPVYFVLMAL